MANRFARLSASIRKQIGTLSNVAQHPVLVNSFAILLMRGASTGTRLLVLFFLARTAAPAQFGLIAFTLSVVEIARTVADFGIDLLAIREFAIAQESKAAQAFASLLAFTKLVCSSITYLVVVLFFSFQADSTQFAMIIVIGLLIITTTWSNLSIVYFQAKLRVTKILLPILAVNLLTVATVGVLVWHKFDLLVTIAVLPVAEALNGVVLWRMLGKQLVLTRESWQWGLLLKLLWRSTPLAVTALLVTLYTRMDVVIVNRLLGAEAVGYYGIAFRVTEPFQLVAVSLATSIYSHISTTLATNQQNIFVVIYRYLAGVFLYGLATCLILAVIAPYAIQILLPSYTPSIIILQILSVALVFRTVNTSLTSLIQAHGHFKQITGVAAWNLVLISVALFLLVPRFGVSGAALALLIGEVVNTLIQGWLAKQALTTHSLITAPVEG